MGAPHCRRAIRQRAVEHRNGAYYTAPERCGLAASGCVDRRRIEMPSPFPGMDPYIEGQRWRDFHGSFLVEIQRALVPQVRPRYVVTLAEQTYVEHQPDPPPDWFLVNLKTAEESC